MTSFISNKIMTRNAMQAIVGKQNATVWTTKVKLLQGIRRTWDARFCRIFLNGRVCLVQCIQVSLEPLIHLLLCGLSTGSLQRDSLRRSRSLAVQEQGRHVTRAPAERDCRTMIYANCCFALTIRLKVVGSGVLYSASYGRTVFV